MKLFKLKTGLAIFILFFSLNCAADENNSQTGESQITTQNSELFAQSNDCSNCSSGEGKQPLEPDDEAACSKPIVTFIELGSVNCIPCKQMQPVMTAIEEKYGKQIKVIFYDVWKPEQKKFARKYEIKLIPTQIFLDESGEEFHRHEGFYPESEIDKILQSKGLKSTGENG